MLYTTTSNARCRREPETASYLVALVETTHASTHTHHNTGPTPLNYVYSLPPASSITPPRCTPSMKIEVAIPLHVRPNAKDEACGIKHLKRQPGVPFE
ncbi:unnamed protein product [Peniophora sp. CBMAI 1063]|nr:unnamed protein product [Peniophora sp. CBMAI 1063]